jgi:hypothetical protein
MKKAWELFEEMRKCKEITPDAHIYSILSNGLLLNCYPDRALDLMIEAIELFGHDHQFNHNFNQYGATELCGKDPQIAKSLMRRLQNAQLDENSNFGAQRAEDISFVYKSLQRFVEGDRRNFKPQKNTYQKEQQR